MVLAFAAATVGAQSAFTNALMSLNPVAYWPLQETAQPPLAQVETNYGSLGAVANAYYSSTNVIPGVQGVTTGDGDTAVYFAGQKAGAFMGVPLTDSRVALSNQAFSVEAWIFPTNMNAGINIIVSQTGNPGAGGLSGGANSAGWALVQNYIPSTQNTHVLGWAFHVFNGVGATGGAEAVVATNFTVNTWYHLVGVFDGVNAFLYVNGTSLGNPALGSAINGSYARDTWDPLVIGSGGGALLNSDQFYGYIDEVAIYPNALTAGQIQNHFSQVGSSTYSSTILGDNPLMYWRMDAPSYTAPATTAYPVANSFGSVANLNGLYLSGTTPGVAGPTNAGLGSSSFACAFNGLGTSATNVVGIYSNGVSTGSNVLASGIIITNVGSPFLPRTNSLSVAFWFKANPADTRYQGLVGRGDSSWKLSLNTDGHLRFFAGVGNDFESSLPYNDGKWHFVTGVYNNSGVATNPPSGPSGWLATNTIYVDGILDNTELLTNANPGFNTTNVILGGAPDYTSSGNINFRPERFFSGSLAHVAYFTNALTTAQVLNLYTNATKGIQAPGAPPVITSQPFPFPSIRQVAGGPGQFIFEAVVVTGLPTLTYQWYFNTTSNYAGATALVDDVVNYTNSQTSQVTITNLTSAKTGYYYAIVSNNYGSVTSAIVNVQVADAPVITAQSPSGAFSLYQNQNATLSVTAIGQPTLTYQWFTNNVADTSAGTAAAYAITAGQTASSGETFQCVVANTFGSATSVLDTLTIQPFPTSLNNSAYSSALLALKPTGYWPMHEVEPPVVGQGDIETNYGTLGTIANGHYADWAVGAAASPLVHHIQGALVGSSNTAVLFNANIAANANGPYYLLVPQPAALLKPPFSVECWWNPQNGNFGDLISQFGFSQNSNNGNPRLGLRVIWTGTQFQMGYGNGGGYSTINGQTGHVTGQWYHMVMTVDNQSNSVIYVNGNQEVSGEILPTTFDPSIPLTIGSGFWGGNNNTTGPSRPVDGAIDEVAFYPTNLSSGQISAHYLSGIDPADHGTYTTTVQADKPAIYFHMDSPTYVAPPASTWAPLTNYGSAAVNGVYSPDTLPGAAAGPGSVTTFAASLAGTNAMVGNGLSSFGDAGASSAFIPPFAGGSFSYSVWFKGNPADCRGFQSLISANDNEWRASMIGTGKLQVHGSGSPDVSTTLNYNDGNWHQMVLTCVETNLTTHGGNTNTLYVDGIQVGVTIGAGTNNPVATPLPDVLIGNETGFTNVTSEGRSFAGSLCEAAFFNGVVLSSNQVQNLYNTAGLPPYILTQPGSTNIDANLAFTNTVLAGGSATLAYQWYQNGSPLAGATNTSLIFNPIVQTNIGNYFVIITNSYGSITSSIASINVLTNPVIVSQFPVTYTNIASTNYMTLYQGASPTFSVNVVGAVPLTYQWYTNGILDGIATTNALQLTNVQSSFSNYYCITTNFLGSITSVVWSASVIAPPVGQGSVGLAPYPQSVLALGPLGYWRMNDAAIDGGENGNGDFGYLCHDYVGGNDGMYTNVTLGNVGYNPVTDPTDTSAQFGEADDLGNDFGDSLVFGVQGVNFSSPIGTSKAFTIEAWVSGFQQTYDAGIATLGISGSEQFNLDTGADTAPTSHGFRFFFRDASGATHLVNSTIVPSAAGQGPWYHLVGVVDEVSSQTVTFYINGLPVGTAAAGSGLGVLASTNVMTIGSRMGSALTNFNFQFFGNINDVSAYNYALSPSQVLNQYVGSGVAPFLTQVPTAVTNVSGNSLLVIPATAAGTGPLTAWWSDVHTGTNIVTLSTNGNIFNSTLVVSNVPNAWNNDQLELIVSNAFGGTNVFVTLTVFTNAPVITASIPPQVNLAVGQSYTYSVAVNGASPLVYQWYTNGVAIGGATGTSFSLTAINPGTVTYSVIVTNTFGAATNSSLLTVYTPPTNSFGAYILGLKPVGYWPLQETGQPATTTIETNYGTLGAVGNAYYAVTSGNQTNVLFYQSGALNGSGDTNPGVQFAGPSGTNYAFVPRVSPSLKLVAPFSMETWIKSSSTAFSDLISEQGNGLNAAPGGGNWGGPRLCYAGNNGGGPALQLFCANGAGTARPDVTTGPNTLPLGAWHHCVATYDGTNTMLYVDGALLTSDSTTLAGANAMAPDASTPLTIGDGLWTGTAVGGQRAYTGLEDEVAIYTNILTPLQVTNHYLSGITSGSNYMQTVSNDKPLLYYRMDSKGFTNAPASACPDAVNFGSAPVNATYAPGTRPGFVAGPPITVLSNGVASPINGITACIDAGSNSVFNVSNQEPFSAVCWIQGNPGDSHLQGVITHGGNWALDLVGANGHVIWTNSAGSVSSSVVVNDGNWHFVAGVYDGFNNYIYVDGVQNNFASASGTIASDTNRDIYLGGNAQFTVVGSNQEYLGGSIAQAAFFTNALSQAQIQTMYQLAVPVTVNLNPTNITFTVTGSQLTLSWPADHLGWRLQAQTNSLLIGISNNWSTVNGSTGVTQVVIPINLTNGSVFYRLVYP